MRQLLVVLSLVIMTTNPVYAGSRVYDQQRKSGTTAKVVVERTTTASWYKQGTLTANGERYNPRGLTVAHKTLPFGTVVQLTNPENNRSVLARVNDRGPYIKGREFDVSMRCAELLDMKQKGVAKLLVKVLS